MKRASPDDAIGDAIARATPESLKALREALERRRLRRVASRLHEMTGGLGIVVGGPDWRRA